jgi:hypothetical protein
MHRPTTIRGLLWRLAKLRPKRALAVALGVAALASIAARRAHDLGKPEECPIAQTWFQGDVHYRQGLVFDHDGTGVWTTGGRSGDATRKRMSFRWQNHGSTLTVVADGARRTAEYRVESWSHITKGLCFIQFDNQFLPDDQLATYYTNRP